MGNAGGGYGAVIRDGWWKICLFSLLAGIASALVVLQLPNRYQATAVLMPIGDDGKGVPSLGASLASFGFQVGSSSRIEDLEALFRSKDLTVRVFSKYDVWPSIAGKAWNPKTMTIRKGLVGRLKSRLSGSDAERDDEAPTAWDAIRASKAGLSVSSNKKSGILTLSVESYSADGSAAIVGHYLDEAKSRMQEEALGRAGRNKRFIEEQIAKTFDPLVRDRFYALYGQEVEREMMAKNREQFGFKLIDAPRAPDLKSRPARSKIVLLSMMLAAAAAFLFLLSRRT